MPPKELVDEINKAYSEYKEEKGKEVDYLTFYSGFVACNRNRQKENNRLKEELTKMTSVAEHQQSCNMKRYFKLEQAKEILRELVNNQLMIRVHNLYADEKTNEMLEGALERWFKKAKQFLKEIEK